MALEDEILAVRTDGVPTVWRFAHHRSVYEGSFWDSPRGNVSPDGRFFLFTRDLYRKGPAGCSPGRTPELTAGHFR
jgi:hypothetical protein